MKQHLQKKQKNQSKKQNKQPEKNNKEQEERISHKNVVRELKTRKLKDSKEIFYF